MKKCLLFPGQGAHDLRMLDEIKNYHGFPLKYETICDITNSLPLQEINEQNNNYINQNTISSLLTILVSSLSLDLYLSQNKPPDFLAGYSVGQWTALYANKVASFEKLIEIVKKRAELMQECFEQVKGGMIAVIGVKEDLLKELCETITAQTGFISISNYNCFAQYTLAGTENAVLLALELLPKLKPKKVLRLPVSGAWHCKLLENAKKHFEEYLQSISLIELKYPTIDNTSGDFLPKNLNDYKHLLASHISNPVMWEKGIKKLLSCDCKEFVEIGYGKTLTKFGFFIERNNIKHKNFLT